MKTLLVLWVLLGADPICKSGLEDGCLETIYYTSVEECMIEGDKLAQRYANEYENTVLLMCLSVDHMEA